MVLLPKFLGIAVFDQANEGAQEAATELRKSRSAGLYRSHARKQRRGQIEIVTNQTTQGVQAIMLSNNAGDQIAPPPRPRWTQALKSSRGIRRFPVPKANRSLSRRWTLPKRARSWRTWRFQFLGADGGEFAVLSASPDAANQNAWIAAMNEALKDPKICRN